MDDESLAKAYNLSGYLYSGSEPSLTVGTLDDFNANNEGFYHSRINLNNALQIENQKQAIQREAESKLEKKQTEFKQAIDALLNVPLLIASQGNTLSTKTKYTAMTDADGHFTISLPKAERFIIVASAEREVILGNVEHYFWVIPYTPSDANVSSIELNNNNELLTGEDGAKILQLSPPDTSAYHVDIRAL